MGRPPPPPPPRYCSSTVILEEQATDGSLHIRRALVPVYLPETNQVIQELYSCFARSPYYKASIIGQVSLASLPSRVVGSYM
jgi:hypothetical protein